MFSNFKQGSVCATLLYMVVDYCKENNINIPNECNSYQQDDRVPFSVWYKILYEIKKQNDVPALGLRIAEYIKPSYTGIVSYLSFSKSTLFDSIPDFARYNRLAYDLNLMHFEIEGDYIEFSWGDHVGRPGQLVDENSIALFINIIRSIIYPKILPLKSVHFIYEEPADTYIYQKYFQCPVYFNAPVTSIILSVSKLKDIYLPQTDPILHQLLEKQAEVLIEQISSYNQFEQRIRLCIFHCIKNKNLSIESVAQRMGISEKEFKEHLNKYNWSFNDILSKTRKELAEHYLKNPELNIYEIADLLGYSEQSVFQRAFKQWTGLTPLKWRLENIRTKK